MKRTLIALAALSAIAGAAHAQSSVTLYGIVDAAVRYTDHQGPAADSNQGLWKEVGGGMSQSRWGINVREDLGGGLAAIVNLENRFLTDSGANASVAGGAWAQSWVGLQSDSFGRITMGRQYNVLFDVTTSTFASFKYSPYIEAYKPEIAVALGARNDNMVKYAITLGGFTAEVQGSLGEGQAISATNPIGGKSAGAMAKYTFGPFAGGGGYLQREDLSGLKAKGYVVGAAYTQGPIYISGGYAENKFDQGFNSAFLLAGSGYDNTFMFNLGSAALNAAANINVDKRTLWFVGATYQFTPAFNLGVAYWNIDQKQFQFIPGRSIGDPKGDFVAVIADYAFSKRTDAYVGFDYTKVKGPIQFTDTTGAGNGATTRDGFMIGVRHRF